MAAVVTGRWVGDGERWVVAKVMRVERERRYPSAEERESGERGGGVRGGGVGSVLTGGSSGGGGSRWWLARRKRDSRGVWSVRQPGRGAEFWRPHARVMCALMRSFSDWLYLLHPGKTSIHFTLNKAPLLVLRSTSIIFMSITRLAYCSRSRWQSTPNSSITNENPT